MAAIIAADVWKTFLFVLLVLLAGIQSIPNEMYEAVEIDGGNAWHKFRYVTIPHLRPFIFLALISLFQKRIVAGSTTGSVKQ
ncbi:MAG: sugar ABC transporter permease [Acidobacteria bacterium]|nr:sugar ABC transporter permease [Acidobacteriota bacterium]